MAQQMVCAFVLFVVVFIVFVPLCAEIHFSFAQSVIFFFFL